MTTENQKLRDVLQHAIEDLSSATGFLTARSRDRQSKTVSALAQLQADIALPTTEMAKVRIPTAAMEQEFQWHWQQGYKAGQAASKPTAQAQEPAAEVWAELHKLRAERTASDGKTWYEHAAAEKVKRLKAENELAAKRLPRPIPRDLIARIVDEVFDGSIEDTSPIEGIYGAVADWFNASTTPATQPQTQDHLPDAGKMIAQDPRHCPTCVMPDRCSVDQAEGFTCPDMQAQEPSKLTHCTCDEVSCGTAICGHAPQAQELPDERAAFDDLIEEFELAAIDKHETRNPGYEFEHRAHDSACERYDIARSALTTGADSATTGAALRAKGQS